MAKLTKTTIFKVQAPKAETTMEKTTRVVRKIIEGETEERQAKIARLRKSRLEREAGTPVEATPTTRKKHPAKTSS